MNCMILICPLARYYTTLDKDHSQPIVQSLHVLFASKKPGGKKNVNIPLLHNQNCHTFLLSHTVTFGLNCGFDPQNIADLRATQGGWRGRTYGGASGGLSAHEAGNSMIGLRACLWGLPIPLGPSVGSPPSLRPVSGQARIPKPDSRFEEDSRSTKFRWTGEFNHMTSPLMLFFIPCPMLAHPHPYSGAISFEYTAMSPSKMAVSVDIFNTMNPKVQQQVLFNA